MHRSMFVSPNFRWFFHLRPIRLISLVLHLCQVPFCSWLALQKKSARPRSVQPKFGKFCTAVLVPLTVDHVIAPQVVLVESLQLPQSRILSHALSRVGTRQLAYMPSPGQNALDKNKGASAERAVSHCMHAQGTGVENSSGFRTSNRAQLKTLIPPTF